jgi:hypothetical protein
MTASKSKSNWDSRNTQRTLSLFVFSPFLSWGPSFFPVLFLFLSLNPLLPLFLLLSSSSSALLLLIPLSLPFFHHHALFSRPEILSPSRRVPFSCSYLRIHNRSSSSPADLDFPNFLIPPDIFGFLWSYQLGNPGQPFHPPRGPSNWTSIRTLELRN